MRILNDNRLSDLFHKYIEGSASREELRELFDHIRESGQDDLLREQIIALFRQGHTQEDADGVDWEAMLARITGDAASPVKKPLIRKIAKWASVAAAVLVVIAGATIAFIYLRGAGPIAGPVASIRDTTGKDILPGGNKAVLTLANGATILLDSAGNGTLARQGGSRVVKVKSGQLAYNTGKERQAPEGNTFNTLTVPRGGQYQLILPDGTKVWLNAASSLRYPVAFTGKERKVELSGEAYFEVVHKTERPFRIQVGKEMIEDLGTHFNVHAYTEEPLMKTTLLEGSVKVGNTILKPGEQASVDKGGRITVLKDQDVNDAVAWKNGFFAFQNDNLQTVMRELARWYNVSIVYQPGAGNQQQFSGRIDRSLTLTQVLNGLAQTKAHFRIEADRKVVILP
ncbi:FecR family protein [Compostibacter hankyongensis]|uniref:FecR family protein n=1 Tax=Compostibacter hankyongensis TaxID=1007089 RepID=A0ABP8FJG9_9BACT